MPTPTSSFPRSHHLDNLRTFLTTLVILSHASISYGGTGTWIYISTLHTRYSSLPLLAFNILNQTFFMAVFFLLSGYFTALAAAKKGRGEFLREKVKRLGIPMVVYSLFVNPGIWVMMQVMLGEESREGGLWKGFWREVGKVRGVRGPVWYCGLLLVFDGVYAVVRRQDFGAMKRKSKKMTEKKDDGDGKRSERHSNTTTKVLRRPGTKPQTISPIQVFFAFTVTSTLSFLIRISYPLGTRLRPLNINPGYVPQYLLFYTTGILAHTHYKTGLSSLIPRRTRITLILAFLLITISGLLSLKSQISTEQQRTGTRPPIATILPYFRGGFNHFSSIYSLWNEVTGILITSIILSFFKNSKYLNQKWTFWGFDVARYSYPAFLVHVVVLVFVQCVTDQWVMGNAVVKAGIVGAVAVVGSWMAGWGLVRGVEGTVGKGYV
ncbi:uncharacterized protein BDR25DRAFT_13002 [Lindgomyces ingoldianus]|uniref:Uncharacterized protein n=1 Tax=Lindgomyces ingoldianus TaxID=673940 RepID=A0ACB6R3H2_9PLEO|nr:uncharacterized protein BDR25DRAFT_13002 [Lindgomyces ingoldianus]KAF2472986.1 hypothetical protein BDR25DRAFT_13002 [Lindgomyces ingoldianus]